MSDVVIDVKNVTIRFNMASEKIDNLKEYFCQIGQERVIISGIFGGKRCVFSGA